jgi:hypothetical protein
MSPPARASIPDTASFYPAKLLNNLLAHLLSIDALRIKLPPADELRFQRRRAPGKWRQKQCQREHDQAARHKDSPVRGFERPLRYRRVQK